MNAWQLYSLIPAPIHPIAQTTLLVHESAFISLAETREKAQTLINQNRMLLEERETLWKSMSAGAKSTFVYGSVPGSPWQEQGEGAGESSGPAVVAEDEPAPDSFLLVHLRVNKVDHLNLKTRPNPRYVHRLGDGDGAGGGSSMWTVQRVNA